MGGLSVRDQMVGPWQVPVADCAVTASSFEGLTGEAIALGERGPVAATNGPASARLAVADTITNIAAARIKSRSTFPFLQIGCAPAENQLISQPFTKW